MVVLTFLVIMLPLLQGEQTLLINYILLSSLIHSKIMLLSLGNNEVTKQGQPMEDINITEQDRNACQGMVRHAYRTILVC